MANAFGISPRTAGIHRANVMHKLGCRSLAKLTQLMPAAGFAPPQPPAGR